MCLLNKYVVTLFLFNCSYHFIHVCIVLTLWCCIDFMRMGAHRHRQGGALAPRLKAASQGKDMRPSKKDGPCYTGGSAVGRWTCDLQVAGSIPGRWLSRNIGQLSLASLRGR